MARLSFQRRKKLNKSTFAIPGKKNDENPSGHGGYSISRNDERDQKEKERERFHG